MRKETITLTLLACTCILSCTTTREIHHHHYQQADTLATQSQADTHVSASTVTLDSMLNAAIARQSASWFSHEDNTETITETITTAIDSLGRELRTEQRTTTRTLSREEEQQQERLQMQMQLQLQRQMQQYDSLFHAFESQMKAHWEEATANDEQTIKNTQPLTWWERLKAKVGGIAIAILLAVIVLFFTRQWWRKILKR